MHRQAYPHAPPRKTPARRRPKTPAIAVEIDATGLDAPESVELWAAALLAEAIRRLDEEGTAS